MSGTKTDEEDPYPHVDDEEEEEKHTNGRGNGFRADEEIIVGRSIIDPTKWEGVPEPERQWIVPNWIPRGYVTALYGPPGLGKSIVMMMLQVALAVGRNWLGILVPVMRTYGWYCEEDSDELHRRLGSICRFMGVRFADLGNMRMESRLGQDNILATFDSEGKIKVTPTLVEFANNALNFHAELFLWDTLADGFSGSQNDMAHARQFVSVLGRVARYLRSPDGTQPGAVWINAHPSIQSMREGTGRSGSVQWEAAFRSKLYLETPRAEDGEEPDPLARVLQRMKSNYAARDEVLPLQWHDWVFRRTDITERGPRLDAEGVFLICLDAMNLERRFVCSNSRAGNYAPKMFVRRPERQDYKVRDFERAMERLFSMGEIRIEQYRAAGHPHERIMRAREPGADDVPF